MKTHCLPGVRRFPDGFCFDRAGRVYCAGSLGDVVVVFEPDGRVREIIETGAGTEPTNCCLGDGVLYVTLSGPGQLVSRPIDAEPCHCTRRSADQPDLSSSRPLP